MRDISNKSKNIFVGEELIANEYTRVVAGGRGKYLEIPEQSFNKEILEVQPGQEYRLTDKWKNLAFYAWYRTKVNKEKVYFQYKKVDYADYLPGYYYIGVKNLKYDGELYEETSSCPLD